MASSSISKIHVASSTGLSLNERFTAIATQPAAVPNRRRSRSRSRSRGRDMQKVNPATSMANRRLLQQLARRHKMNAAMKLKRRSMRTIGAAAAANGGPRTLKRGSVQAFRVAPNGRPIKANSMARTATMKADYVMNRNNRPLRRANSISNRVGNSAVGGAAERVAKRHLERLAGDGGGRKQRYLGGQRRSRSRSRSRTRLPRDNNAAVGPNIQRGRSRSRSRGRPVAGAKVQRVPIQARLGLRPGAAPVRGRRIERNRGANMSQRGVAEGRVEKRRRPNGTGNVEQRGRSRSKIRGNVNENGRSRSRQRRGSVGQLKPQQQQQQQQQPYKQNGRRVRPSRQLQPQKQQNFQRQRQQSQQRPQKRNGQRQRNERFPQKQAGNKPNGNNKPAVQRRGRSRSRGNRNNGGQNLGNKNIKQNPVKKEDLDVELDQYMSTTKTDGELDYLLKN